MWDTGMAQMGTTAVFANDNIIAIDAIWGQKERGNIIRIYLKSSVGVILFVEILEWVGTRELFQSII